MRKGRVTDKSFFTQKEKSGKIIPSRKREGGTCRLCIRQMLNDRLENCNYQVQKPGPIEHPLTSFLVIANSNVCLSI